MSNVVSRAIRTFVGPDGVVRRGSLVSLTQEQASSYERAGLVEPVDRPAAPDVRPAAGPSRTAVVSPTSKESKRERVEAVHRGGGHYDVGGESVRGKDAAEARVREMNGE